LGHTQRVPPQASAIPLLATEIGRLHREFRRLIAGD
jgi:hypothetical protein